MEILICIDALKYSTAFQCQKVQLHGGTKDILVNLQDGFLSAKF
jgi:hypothetical protein